MSSLLSLSLSLSVSHVSFRRAGRKVDFERRDGHTDAADLSGVASVASLFGEASRHLGAMVLRPPCFLSLCFPPPRPWQRAFSPPPRMPHPRGPGRTAYLGSRILRARWGQMRPVC